MSGEATPTPRRLAIETRGPLHGRGRVPVPGSKSITNRALLLAALADGESRLTGGLESDDTVVMRTALETLGIRIKIEKAAAEETVETPAPADLTGAEPIAAYDFDSLVAMITTLANAKKTADVVAALTLHGVQKASELKPEQYGTFGAALQAAI